MNRTMTISWRELKATASVEVVRETKWAVLLRAWGFEAWFPKSAISEDGEVKSWFCDSNKMGYSHKALFFPPPRPKSRFQRQIERYRGL